MFDTSDAGLEITERTLSGAVAQRDALVAFVGGLDPESVPLPEASAWWAAFDRMERVANSAKTLLARRVAAGGEWRRKGYASAAEFMAHESGSSPAAVRRELDASKQLAKLPRTQEAAKRGDLSDAQLGLIAGAAAQNPDAEGRLLATAGSGSLRELKDQAQRARAAADPDPAATETRIHRARSFRSWTDADGTWRASLAGTIAAGARIEQALAPLSDRHFREAARAGRREGRDACAFDAALALLTAGSVRPAPTSHGAPSATPPRFLLQARVDLEALRRGYVEGDELCEIRGLGPIPVERARALLGESLLQIVLTRGVEVKTIAPAGRGWTAHQRTAALWQSDTCSVAGCGRRRVQLDHRQGFADGGPTMLANADPLCPFHHDLKTHHGWALVAGAGKRPFVAPDDPRHPRNHPPP